VDLIDDNWLVANYSPKPTIASILNYPNAQNLPLESVIIIPYFSTTLIAEALSWREWNYICECWVTSHTDEDAVESMLTEVVRILDNYNPTGYWVVYPSDFTNKSDKNASPKRYKIIFNINCRKEESY